MSYGLLGSGRALIKIAASAIGSQIGVVSLTSQIAVLSVAESLLGIIHNYGPVRDIGAIKDNLIAQQSAKTRGLEEDNLQKRAASAKTIADAIALVNNIPAIAPARELNADALREANDALLRALSRLVQEGGELFVDTSELERLPASLTDESEASAPRPPIEGESNVNVDLPVAGTGKLTPPAEGGAIGDASIGSVPFGG